MFIEFPHALSSVRGSVRDIKILLYSRHYPHWSEAMQLSLVGESLNPIG